jgi:DNA-binding XRE family transcriptional regulator
MPTRTAASGPPAARPSPQREQDVLTTAVLRAADRLGLKQAGLAGVLGVSPASLSRMAAGKYRLDPARKEWELAALFVRMFRSLDSIVGSDDETARAWLHGENLALSARPIDRIATVEGLTDVLRYLDAARGRI